MSGMSALKLGELLGIAEPAKENKDAEVIDFKDAKDEVKDAKDANDNADSAEDEADSKITIIKEKAGKVVNRAKDVAEKATEKAKKKKDKSTKPDILPGVILPTSGLDDVDDSAEDDFDPVDDSAEDQALAELLDAVKDIDGNDDVNDVNSSDTSDASDVEDDGAADVIRKDSNKEEEDMAVNMKDMSFYNAAGQKIYDVDRGMPMDTELKSWIVSQFLRDSDLAKAVVKTLPAIIAGNPKFVPDLKRIIKDTAESNVPYTVTYLDKMTEKEYESRDQAEKATEELRKKLNLKFSDVCSLVYRKIGSDGKFGGIVTREEVEAFVSAFDGDREALAKKLQLPNKKN